LIHSNHGYISYHCQEKWTLQSYETQLCYHIHSNKLSERQREVQQYWIKYTRISVNGTNNRSIFQQLDDMTTTLLSCFHSSLILGHCLERMTVSCINLIRMAKRAYDRLQRINWSPLYCLQNPDDMVTMFNSIVNQVIDQFMVPHVTWQHFPRNKPWINERFRYLVQRRQFA